MTAASLARRDAAADTGFTCRLTSLVCTHMPYAMPAHCSPIDPTAQALAIAREHYDALTAADCGLTPLRERLAAMGVLTTTAVAKTLQRELLLEQMRRELAARGPGFAVTR